jgi:hypothetical protein
MRNNAAIRCAVGLCVIAGTSFVRADDQPAEGMMVNPIYKHWAAFQPGATVTMREKIKFPAQSEEGQRYVESTLVKDTTYKLLSVSPEKAVVEVVEAEHGRGSLQESAPFKITYFAHIKKGLGTPKEHFAKHSQEEVEVQAHGKTYKATLVETTHKNGPETRTQKIWLSDEIPGGVVKEEKVQKHGDEPVSESTLEILVFSKGA